MSDNALYGGFVKMYRSFLDWEWYADTNCVRLAVHFLLKANYRMNKWRGVVIGRGQLVVSRSKLADETGLTEMQIRTAMDKLVASGFITKLPAKIHTIVTVCNYDIYQPITLVNNQDDNQDDNQQITNLQPTNQPTGNQPDNQDNNQAQKYLIDGLSDCLGVSCVDDNQSNNQHGLRKVTNNITATKEYKKERIEEYTHTPVCTEKGVVGGKGDASDMLAWIAERFPDIQRMAEPLDEIQMSQMLAKYEAADIRRILAAMDNKKAFKNKNAFSTFSIYARYDDVLRERRRVATEQRRIYTYEEMCNEIPIRAKAEDFERIEIDGRAVWRKKIYPAP